MTTQAYRTGRGSFLRHAFLVLFASLVLLLLYLFLPLGSQRVVLLGSDARAGEPSRSDTIMIARAGGGLLAIPRDTLVGRYGGRSSLARAHHRRLRDRELRL